MSDAGAIDYASGSRRDSWLRRNWRWLARSFVLAAIAGAAWYWRGPIQDYGDWHYWNWRLRQWEMPPVLRSPSPSDADRARGATVSPIALRKLLWNSQWLRDRLSPSPASDVPTEFAYVGQRSRPDGQWRTVVITALNQDPFDPLAGVHVAVLRPPAWTDGPPQALPSSFAMTVRAGPGPHPASAIYRIGDDPADASAISIEVIPNNAGDERLRSRFVARLANDDRIDWTVNGQPIARTSSFPQPTP